MNIDSNNIYFRSGCLVVLLVGLVYFGISAREGSRVYGDIDALKVDIALATADLVKLKGQDDLPNLENVWQAGVIIARQYSLNLTSLKSKNPVFNQGRSKQGGKAWYGVINGNTDDVVLAALEMQKRIPIIFGTMAVTSGVSQLSFVVNGQIGDLK